MTNRPYISAALRRLTAHFDADQVSFAVTINATADPDLLTTWAAETGAALYAVADRRYFHGKLVQWSDDDGTHALVGSANITAAAMLKTTGDPRGNCELALLCQLGDADLTPPVGEQLNDADAVRRFVAEPRPETARDAATPRLLRVLLDGPDVLVTIIADTARDIDALLLPDQDPHPLVLVESDDRVHRFRTQAAAVGGSVCHVRLVDGSLLGPIRVTDAVAVEVRPGNASPLQDRRLVDVLSDRRLSDRLFQALQELAAARPATTPGTRSVGAGEQPDGWRRAAERMVGSALVRLALGRGDHENGEATQGEGLDPADVVDETDNDDDGIDLFDDEDHDMGLRDPLGLADDPVTRLLADPITAARLATKVDALVPQTADWHAGALLALTRVTLLVAAGGGWSTPERAAESVGSVLLQLAGAARGDEDVEAARRAAVLVGLAVLAATVERWDDSANKLVETFERCRSRAAVNPADIDHDRLAHHAADLHIGFGTTLTADSLLDATTFLLTSTPIERATETLSDEYRDLALAAPRLLRIQSNGNPYGPAMRLLTRLAHLAPVAVHAVGPKGGVYAAWQPRPSSCSGSPPAGRRSPAVATSSPSGLAPAQKRHPARRWIHGVAPCHLTSLKTSKEPLFCPEGAPARVSRQDHVSLG